MSTLDKETPGPIGTRILPAGVEWDAVRVPHAVALTVLDKLGSAPGAILVDPQEQALYFFVPPRATDEWELANVRLLGVATFVVVPPPERIAPPGPYWLAEPGRQPWPLADAEALHAVLAEHVASTSGTGTP
ncbi:hypothetical protein GCM10009801_21340 [Streptomyces albiaxialis]|uniref:Uncharacterized protein n=1 Tax=Streptomyces albiaxialis TaxID=329523 RepID=A0ABN2VSK1_9ACTN